MPQSINEKVVNTFIKGLITEAGELTFPPDASTDELNCLLERDGSRRRRLAVEYETNVVNSSFSLVDTEVFSTSLWTNVAGQAGLTFLVVQAGSILYFYNTSTQPYSGQQKSFSVNIEPFEFSGSAGSSTVRIQTTAINGSLVVVSGAISPFYIEYNTSNDTITTSSAITFETRDFEWQGDIKTYDAESSGTVPDSRKWDTLNSGWVGTKGLAARESWSRHQTLSPFFPYNWDSTLYPPLTHPWYSGKNSSGDFSAEDWDEIYGGSTLIGNGHFILNFFNKVRESSGTTFIPTEVEPSRFRTVAAFSGRVFYSGLNSAKNGGRILFSKVIDNISESGRCYQQNDPTAETLSDLLATDGGVINLPDAVNIQKLHVQGSSILVFAENGVWQISGVDNVFRATEYSIAHVSSIGINNPETFVDVGGSPMWWSKVGIHTLTVDPVSGNVKEQNLTISTIQTFWDLIDGNAKTECTGIFDEINKRILWFYPKNSESDKNKKSKILSLDLNLQAFYPWEIADSSSDVDYVIGAQFFSGYGSDFVLADVKLSNGDDVILSNGDDVVQSVLSELSNADSSIVLMVKDTSANKMKMALFKGINFLDWGNANYVSFAEAGYEFMGDLILKKSSPYLVTYLRPTETGWTGSAGSGYTPIRQSSMLVSAYWDFRKTVSSTAQEAYRLKYVPVVDPANLNSYNYPDEMVTTRLKLRGSGRSARLRFESAQGKDFVLLGYGMINAVNQRF